ncbi:hypothetical protein B425_0591 [Bacillus amyloliquefaciens]|nr:hypothetical protein B425_0591 [Bacillus amyloliquefaciens]
MFVPNVTRTISDYKIKPSAGIKKEGLGPFFLHKRHLKE